MGGVGGCAIQEGYEAVGVIPEGGRKDDQRAGAPPLQVQAETAESFQPREEKPLGGPYSGLQESWSGSFYKGM